MRLCRSGKRRNRLPLRHLVACELLEPRLVLDSTVVFNEIMYNPPETGESLEWIEFHNQMSVNMDLSQWTVTGGVGYRFPEGTTVPAGEYIVLARDPAALAVTTGFAGAFGPFVGQLSNGGELLELRNKNDRLMDAVDFGDGGSWPVGPDGSGSTLAKDNPQSASSSPVNWKSSAQIGGTPGTENFPIFDPTPERSTVIPLDSTWRYEDSGADLGTGWRNPEFNDASWNQGPGLFAAGDIELVPTNPQAPVHSNSPPIMIDNPSFEGNTNSGVGYGGVDGWISQGGTGINPASGGAAPFADNGQIPDSRQIAFIQGTGSLSQTISGLDTTKQYWLQFYYNARACCGANPALSVSFAGTTLVSPTEVTPVSGDNPYYLASVPFTPMVSSGQLTLRNVGSAGDHSLLLDAIAINQRDPDHVTIQNPSFEASGAVTPAPGYLTGNPLAGWIYTSEGGQYGVNSSDGPFHDNGTIPDGSQVAFLQQPGSLSQTINGLTPGQTYELQFYYNARAATDPPRLIVTLDDAVIQDTEVVAVGGNEPYHANAFYFVADNAAKTLTFRQTHGLPTDQALTIDNVTIREVPFLSGTELSLGPTTTYFRHEFEFNDDPARTDLSLRTLIDDGAIVYLNGTEVLRSNMPAGVVGHQTLASNAIGTPALGARVNIPADSLVAGMNVLAVEVHQASVGDADMAFGLELAAAVRPIDPTIVIPTVAINEMAGTEDTTFFVELFNYGDEPIDLTNFELVAAGGTGGQFILPASILEPGEYQAFAEDVLGFGAEAGDRLFLLTRNTVVDAVETKTRLRGRLPAGTGEWLFPDLATPGTANSFELQDNIVINEIMFHSQPIFSKSATVEETRLLPIDGPWRYNPTGTDLGVNWQTTTHAVDDLNWFSGPGPIGAETAVLQVPLGTELEPFDRQVITYYFEQDFAFDGVDGDFQLTLNHMIDDGAVFYLNGVEVLRFQMPEGEITAATVASASVSNAELSGPIIIPHGMLQMGTNTLSVEVHQRAAGSRDLVFGVEVALHQVTDPATEFRRTDEQWIELYNRGNVPVDLSQWQLTDAVTFEFAAGTTIDPDGYLVVARNRDVLAVKYPDVADTIIGNFSGRLSRRDENILLLDRHGNPADAVHYYDGGHWPAEADGGGASLELRDANADNSKADSWAASDESSRSAWSTYRYRATAREPSGANNPGGFHELIIGLLDEGEVLLDDIRVIEDPTGSAVNRLQNGSFQADVAGTSPAAWRIIGNHDASEVILDPENEQNKVLRLIATGATEHMHNHGETTFADGAAINVGGEYEISFRAKWISGSPQVNTRLYFNKAARTTVLDVPDRHGTPGVVNSTAVLNLGPSFDGLSHTPVVPAAGEPVAVSIQADDPDDVTQLRLFYAVAGGPFTSLTMTADSNGRYTATIPGQEDRATVQFYVQGTDGLGEASVYPSGGTKSRALYRVDSSAIPNTAVHSLRLIMTPDDAEFLHTDSNVMSNDRLGATVIYNDREVFYDVGVRLRASGFGRRGGLAGFNIRFQPDQLFRGVHQTVAVDRGVVFTNGDGTGPVSGSPGASPHELLIYQIAHHGGGIPGMYDDVVYIDAPRPTNTGLGLLKMARYTDVYLDSQFDNGGDGSLFKYELVYHATQTVDGNPESLKQGPNAVRATEITDLGDDKEAYRINFVLKNNRTRDDFQRIIDLGKALSESGSTLDLATQQVMDVDQWMRVMALHSLTGGADTYNMGLAHNLDLYVRPEDQKVLAFPWDVDHGFFYAPSAPLLGRGGSRLHPVIQLPHNTRLFYKHLLDLIETTYNTEYLADWIDHYAEVTGEDVAAFLKEYVAARNQYVSGQLNVVAPQVSFEISTNGGNDFTVNESTATLAGDGWIDVDEIRFAGSDQPLDVTWTNRNSWQLNVPLDFGANPIQLEAYNLRGELVGSAAIIVTSTVTDRPLQEFLRISEIMYNPADPTPAEAILGFTNNDDFEYVELLNISAGPESTTLNLEGVAFTDGINFTFGPVLLEAGQRIVVARDSDAFVTRHGSLITPTGEYDGGLANDGEDIELQAADGGTILRFAYNDRAPWPERADGVGGSIVVVDAAGTPVDEFGKHDRWRGSTEFGGSPGILGEGPVGIVINEVLTNTDDPAGRSDSIELYNTTSATVNIGGWRLSDSADQLLKYAIPEGTFLEPGEYLVLDESNFNPNPSNPGPDDFALSGSRGDSVWLTIANDMERMSSFVDDVHFGASLAGESFGRVPNGRGQLAPQARLTLGCSNLQPRVGPIVVTELQYSSGSPSAAALAVAPTLSADDLEYVEIHNPTGETVVLKDWRIRGGVDFEFDDAAILAAGSTLTILSFDPTNPQNASRLEAFRIHYGLDNSVALAGGYAGQLDDNGERIELERPDASPPNEPGFTPRVTEDEFLYDDRVPWPSDANGTGNSLQRLASVFAGNHGRSWVAARPTPGMVDFGGNVTGDFTGDGVIAADDIDVLFDAIQAGADVAYLDLDGNRTVDNLDVSHLLTEVLHSLPGDANLDGVVDGSDFNTWNEHRFSDCGRSWSDGEFSGDGLVDASDFNIWSSNRFQSGLAAATGAGDADGQRMPRAAVVGENATRNAKDNDVRDKIWRTSSSFLDTPMVNQTVTMAHDALLHDKSADRGNEGSLTHDGLHARIAQRYRGSLQRRFRDTSTDRLAAIAAAADHERIDEVFAGLLAERAPMGTF